MHAEQYASRQQGTHRTPWRLRPRSVEQQSRWAAELSPYGCPRPKRVRNCCQKPEAGWTPVPEAFSLNGERGSSLVIVNSAERAPLPAGANWMVTSDSPPAGMAMGNAGAGFSEKSALPLVSVIEAIFKAAVPTLKSCTGMARLVPVLTVPKPTVAMGLVARRCTSPV